MIQTDVRGHDDDHPITRGYGSCALAVY